MPADIQRSYGVVAIVVWICTCALSACRSDDSGKSSSTESEPEQTSEPEDSNPQGSDPSDSASEPFADPGPSCPDLAGPQGNVVTVSPSDSGDLQQIVQGLSEGDTLSFEDGTYSLGGAYLWISAPGVTFRSASGDREAVVIDANYDTSEIITVAASNVTIADLTIRRPSTHAIHVVSTDEGDTLNTLIYNVHIIDPGEQGIKINPDGAKTHVTDRGIVACSHIELTDAGRPHVNPTSGGCYTGGVDAHYSEGWVVRDNLIEGFYCPSGLSEHAIHFWNGCKDTLVERNRLYDNARGVGLGMSSEGDTRDYDDATCSSNAYVDHFGGIVRNNFIFASSDNLFASEGGFDCGICFWSACGATAVHNSVVSLGDNFSSIEWRFEGSQDVHIANNLVSHSLRERDGASAVQERNLEQIALDFFADIEAGDLHLTETATSAIDQGASLDSGLCDEDIDGVSRGDFPDIGADER